MSLHKMGSLPWLDMPYVTMYFFYYTGKPPNAEAIQDGRDGKKGAVPYSTCLSTSIIVYILYSTTQAVFQAAPITGLFLTPILS